MADVFNMTAWHTPGFTMDSPLTLTATLVSDLIIVGSRAFFYGIPDSESMLEKNCCFKALLIHCEEQKTVFSFSPDLRKKS
ncbi:hypothetical protein [Desulfocicer niacini]